MTLGHWDGPGFGLMSPVSKRKMKRRKGGRVGEIDIDDLMMKCRQKVVLGAFEWLSYCGVGMQQ